MIRLMLADDHVMLREGLRSQFSEHPDFEVVGEAANIAELLEQLPKTKPDVLILDLHYPGSNAMTLLPQVRHVCPTCKIVILTMYDHARYVSQTLKDGASGFVVKGAPFEELLQAVRQAHRGRIYICKVMRKQMSALGHQEQRGDPLHDLSSREFEVLILLGNGLAMKEIASQLNVSQKSVDTYRARVQKKLQLKNKTDVIRFVLENGLVS